jgi:hypothetical protein
MTLTFARFGLASLVRDIDWTSELRDRKKKEKDRKRTIKDVVGRPSLVGRASGG